MSPRAFVYLAHVARRSHVTDAKLWDDVAARTISELPSFTPKHLVQLLLSLSMNHDSYAKECSAITSQILRVQSGLEMVDCLLFLRICRKSYLDKRSSKSLLSMLSGLRRAVAVSTCDDRSTNRERAARIARAFSDLYRLGLHEFHDTHEFFLGRRTSFMEPLLKSGVSEPTLAGCVISFCSGLDAKRTSETVYSSLVAFITQCALKHVWRSQKSWVMILKHGLTSHRLERMAGQESSSTDCSRQAVFQNGKMLLTSVANVDEVGRLLLYTFRGLKSLGTVGIREDFARLAFPVVQKCLRLASLIDCKDLTSVLNLMCLARFLEEFNADSHLQPRNQADANLVREAEVCLSLVERILGTALSDEGLALRLVESVEISECPSTMRRLLSTLKSSSNSVKAEPLAEFRSSFDSGWLATRLMSSPDTIPSDVKELLLRRNCFPFTSKSGTGTEPVGNSLVYLVGWFQAWRPNDTTDVKLRLSILREILSLDEKRNCIAIRDVDTASTVLLACEELNFYGHWACKCFEFLAESDDASSRSIGSLLLALRCIESAFSRNGMNTAISARYQVYNERLVSRVSSLAHLMSANEFVGLLRQTGEVRLMTEELVSRALVLLSSNSMPPQLGVIIQTELERKLGVDIGAHRDAEEYLDL